MDSINLNLINIIITIVCTILGIIFGALCAWWSISQSRKLAIQSGVLKKAESIISFMKILLSDFPYDDTRWIILFPKNIDGHTQFPLSFQIYNDGDATLENAHFLIQGSKFIIPLVPEDCFQWEVQPGILSNSIKRSVDNLGGLNQISYLLPPIPSKVRFEITDYFMISPTFNRQESATASTTDGKSVIIQYSLSTSYILTITLLPNDAPSISYSLKLECICANSIDEALKLYNKAFLEKIKKESPIPVFKKLMRRIFNKPFKKFLIFMEFQTDKTLTIENEKIYLMKQYRNEIFKIK